MPTDRSSLIMVSLDILIPFYRHSLQLYLTFKICFPSIEKQLRDAAAAEVAVHGLYGNDELGDKASRKRKHMNADEKAKQK